MAFSAAGTTEFIISAARPEQFPPEGLPEVAFLGRSNVGKSSLLNRLTGKKLAFTSSTPGRTQGLNFYRVNSTIQFVDLPGYGYARVPRETQAAWKDLIERYLSGRGALSLSILLLDARRGWMERDLELRRWLEFQERRHLVVATKIDKLNARERNRGLVAIAAQMNGARPVPFSAVTGEGVREIWQAILNSTTP